MKRGNRDKRARLMSTKDPFTLLQSGSIVTYEGKAMAFSGKEQHSIKLDNGSRLMLITPKVRFEFAE